MKYMYKTQWVVVNSKGKKIKEVTLKHKDGRLYRELEPFEKELKEEGLRAFDKEVLMQDHLKGLPLIEKLRQLGVCY